MRVYLAGPMRGLPEFNFPAFFAAEEYLTAGGFDVVNPARDDVKNGFQWEGAAGSQEELDAIGFDFKATILRDLELVASCDAVLLLPGWEDSAGAAVEVALAKALGLKLFLQGDNPGRYDMRPAEFNGLETR